MDAIPDQLALAANPAEPNKYRRGDSYAENSEEPGDYSYGNSDVNFIPSGGKAPPAAAAPSPRMLPHQQLNSKYLNRIRSEAEAQLALDESKTAEEYVAKAMQMHGARLNEPIRIPAEAEAESEEASSQAPKAPLRIKHSKYNNNNDNNKTKYDFYEMVGKKSPEYEQPAQKQQQQDEEPLQQEHRQEQDEEPQRHAQQQQLQHQRYQQQQQQQQHQHYKYQQQQQQQQPNPKQILDSQLQDQLQIQMQQAQLLAEQQAERQQQEAEHRHQQTQNEQQHHQVELHQHTQMVVHQQGIEPQQYEALTERDPAAATPPQQPAPVYEKDPVTRSYELYDTPVNYEQQQQQLVDRHYHTKYRPVYHGNNNEAQQQNEEKIRVSASTEIPKAEIMKQIEKSVMRYMKELEAEGKIITTSTEPHPPPKSYYKVMSLAAGEDKRPTSGPLRTKFTSSTSHLDDGYAAQGGQSAQKSQGPTGNSASIDFSVGNRHHSPKHATQKPQYRTPDPESPYQAPISIQQQHQDMSEALAPNVEFIYKIKAHAPLQTATVKTVSKPYTLPLKSYDQFDHSAALKNLEDFDLSHVVTTQDPDDHLAMAPPHTPHTGKPTKLYFNSEIYHDINSLPYKPEKTRRVPPEYRKSKPSDQSSEYKAYNGNFADHSSYSSASASNESGEKDSRESGVPHVDEGYPVMNPYQYVLKKEPLPNQYEDSPSAAPWDKHRTKPSYTQSVNAQKALEYDSYSPKFNNNPEGYGYQHSFKLHGSGERERDREPIHSNHKYGGGRHGGSKRGKRGGGPAAKGGAKKNPLRSGAIKDIEANLALRPPPKV